MKSYLKKNLFNVVAAAAVVFSLGLLSGCATTVPVKVTRPAELNLGGAKTICILPFSTSSSSSYNETGNTFVDVLQIILNAASNPIDRDEEYAADYITQQVKEYMLNSPYITLVGSSAVQSALQNGTTPPCDVYLSGELYNFSNTIEEEDDYCTASNGERYLRTYYKRHVKGTVRYEVISSATNKIIATRRQAFEDTSTRADEPRNVESASSLVKDDLQTIANNIACELQPYTETVNIQLTKVDSKNETLKTADKLADQGMVEDSLKMFMDYYKQTGDYSAGYNAAKLLEAQGRLTEAEEILHTLSTTTGKSEAVKAYQHIQYEIQQLEKLNDQLNSIK